MYFVFIEYILYSATLFFSNSTNANHEYLLLMKDFPSFVSKEYIIENILFPSIKQIFDQSIQSHLKKLIELKLADI